MKYSWLFLAALTLAGCRTPYMAYDCEPTGTPWPFPGWNCQGGYSELELATETYQVSFSGRDISTAKSQDYALLRAAELTLQRGHRYFLVVGTWSQTDVQLHSNPGTSQTTHHSGGGHTTTSFGGGTSSTTLPQASYVIRILGASEEQDPNAYDALKIQRSVRQKYRLPPLPADVASGS